mgnify:CR=1 FL=1
MTGNIIVKPSVRQRFDSFMERGRVLFFSAPCGFGKSTLSDTLLSGRYVLRLNAGAGFVVVLTGAIVTMPGLSKNPAAYGIDVDDNGMITGLF